MRKIVLAAATAGVFYLSACGEAKKNEAPAPTPSTTEAPLGNTEKAMVDQAGDDVFFLVDIVNDGRSSAQREYADKKLVGLINKSNNLETVTKVFDQLHTGSGQAKLAALSAKARLSKK
jgi:hypothetical protein